MEDKLSELKSEKKGVEITVDGKVLTLRYDLNALVLLEEKYGDIDKAFEFGTDTKGMAGKIRKVLHTGLLATMPEITETEVGAMFTLENLAQFQEAVEEAVAAGMPEGEDPKVEASKKIPKDHKKGKRR